MPLQKKNFFSISEASQMVGVSPDTLRRLEAKGKIKTVKGAGGKRLFTLENIILLKELTSRRSSSKTYSIEEAATILNVSKDTVRRWEKEGKIISERTSGGHRRFTAEIIKAVKEGSINPQPKVVIPVATPIAQVASVTEVSKTKSALHSFFSTIKIISFVTVCILIFSGLLLSSVKQEQTHSNVLAAETTSNPVMDFISDLFTPIFSFFTNTYNEAQVAFTSFISQPITTPQIASQTPAPSITNITNNNAYNSAPVAISPRSLTGAMIGLKTVKGENLADNTITADKLSPTLTFTANDLLDLSAINHSSNTNQGLILPNVPNSSPSTPTSGKGYIAFDTADNKLIVYTSSGWQTVGSGSSSSTSTTVNNLSGSITLAGAGINAVTTSGSTITVTGTEADTLATVTGRGATTTTALSLGDVSLGASNALVVGSYTTDPTSPSNGTIWYNSTTGKWKIREGGATKILCNTTDAGCGTGGGSTAWSSIIDPVGNLALSMGANTTTFTYNGATGTNNLFKLIDTASNTGTGYIFDVGTAALSNAKPFTIVARGTAIIDTTATGALTLGSATTTLALTSSSWGINSSGTATSLAISGATNTLSNIGNSSLTNSSVTINSSGILTGGGALSLGGSLTLTATEADTLSSVTGRGASTATALTLSSVSPITFSGTTPTITFSGGDTTLDLTGAATRTLNILNSTTAQVSNLNLSDGSLQTGGTTRLDNTGNLSNIGNLAGSGTVSGFTISGASNTLSNIGNSSLTNSSVTINSSGILTGGGSVSLGGSLTLTATEADTLSSVTGRGATTTTLVNLNGGIFAQGARTGKAFVTFDETGDQNILTASAAGVTKLTLDGSGNLTLAGNATVNGGSITTTQTTANIFNATATTLNIGGATTTLALANGNTAATLNIGSGTGGNTINLGNGVNTVAQTLNIGNGATGADSTVNILSGVGTAGAGSLLMADNTRVTTIDLGNVAPAAARTFNIAGGNSAQNDTVNIFGGNPSANTQTFNLFTGTPTGGTQNINIGTGINGGTITIGKSGTLNNASTGSVVSLPDGLFSSGVVTGKANFIINSTGGTQNILTASASGTTVLTLARSGDLTLASNTSTADAIKISPASTAGTAFTGTLTSADLTSAQTWTLPNSTGTICLDTGNCSAAINYLQLNTQVLSPGNNTYDLAVGGTATSSAKFQAFGIEQAAGSIAKLTSNTITTGDVLSATASAITSGNILKLGQGGDSAFSGNVILADIDNTGGGGGTFTGNFLKFNNAAATKFVVSGTGAITAATTANTINNLIINGSTQTLTANNIADSGALTIATGGNGSLTLSPAGTGDLLFNTDADTNFQIAASAPPQVDMFSISNSGQALVTTNTSLEHITFVGGAAAVTGNGILVDLTPGTTSGGTWNGINVAPAATGPGSGVTEAAMRFDTPNSAFTGTFYGINLPL